MTWHDLIREGRKAKGLSQARLAKAIGVSQALIAKIEGGLVQKTVHLSRLIAELELPHSEFPAEAFEDGPELATTASHAKPLPEFARDPAYWAMAVGLVGDVPLFASAEGGEGALIIERDPIGSVRRPPLLQGVKDGYAMYLTGESMVPEFEPGDVLMINPRLPVLPNTSCIFYSVKAQEPLALVKRYLGATDESWRVRQFRPEKDFELSREEWVTRHRIVSKNFR